MQALDDSSHWNNLRSDSDLTRLTGSVIAGRYRLDEVIGRGGMATVWRGHDERLGRDVAVKICPPPAPGTSLPIREEHLSSALLHPNIVSIFDAGDIVEPDPGAGSAFVVMEYVNGTTAHQIAPVAWRQAVNIVRQAADGLAAAHERGIVHCDVKPGNLLIDQRGRVLVADFGIAMPADSELGEFVHGSPAYVAPERLTGERADPRVDVYGLGGVLSYLITGKRPEDEGVILPVDCPSELGHIVARARSRQPHDRYSDAREFREAIDRAIGSASAGRRADTIIMELPATHSGPGVRPRDESESSRRVISHPARVRASNARPRAQQTAAMSPSPIRVARLSGSARTRPKPQHKRMATLIAAGCVGLLLLLAGVVIQEIVSIESAAPGPAPVAAAVSMPDVEGQSLATALATLTEQGLIVKRVDVVYSPGPTNQIIAQEPAAGASIGEGDSISLVVRGAQ
jgi:serine/threonine-protein kinase